MQRLTSGSFHCDGIIVSDENCTLEPSTDRDRTRTGVEAKQSKDGCRDPWKKRQDGEDETRI